MRNEQKEANHVTFIDFIVQKKHQIMILRRIRNNPHAYHPAQRMVDYPSAAL